MKKTFCDVCGDECKRKQATIQLEGGESVVLSVHLKTFQHRVGVDICFRCQEEATNYARTSSDSIYLSTLVQGLDYDD